MRFLLPIAALSILALAGCATTQQKTARAQKEAARQKTEDDTRSLELRRMERAENGQINSVRGAMIVEPDPNMVFDASSHSSTALHGYGTKGTATKDFYTDRRLRADTYQTRDFGTKGNAAADRKYATKESFFKNPFHVKTAATKTAATKESPDANKVAASRDLPDGQRYYLGPERKKLGTSYSAKDLANWRSGESVGYSDGAIERSSSFKQLTVEDIRDLLNKSK